MDVKVWQFLVGFIMVFAFSITASFGFLYFTLLLLQSYGLI